MSTPFDAYAEDYDGDFTLSLIGSLMRARVWRHLDAAFKPGQRVLELSCGTGADAIHLANRGVRVHATDAAARMVKATRRKVQQNALTDRVSVQPMPMEEVSSLAGGCFDGAFSNFGGLNCVAGRRLLAADLACVLPPGATLLVCVMGPVVPWEWLWFLARLAPRKAFRRMTLELINPGHINSGGVEWRGLKVYYPSISVLREEFAPHFECRRVAALGALVPPPYTENLTSKAAALVRALDRLERALESLPPLPWLADHYLMELHRLNA
ncbi:MAG: methyltransferase domain-containing protein [Gammaproteobacteria bacterium]|nr:methyltransferase domain-containing protein [Gammaproteobacteria bacterium]